MQILEGLPTKCPLLQLRVLLRVSFGELSLQWMFEVHLCFVLLLQNQTTYTVSSTIE